MYTFVLASVAVIAICHINAQNLGDLPVCAVSFLRILTDIGLRGHVELTYYEQQVAASAAIIQTGCAITDIACVCRGGEFIAALLEQECDETEQRGELSPSAYQVALKLCLSR